MIQESDNIDAYLRSKMAQETPARRLQMASRMFSTARALVRAGAHESDIDDRTLLFLRFYVRDYSKTERDRILTWLRSE